MSPEEREALLAGYALGSLSAPDAVDAARLARSDADAAAELAAYREIADLIALSVPLRETDPALRQRVLAAARRGRVWRRPRPLRRYLPAAGLAAALLLVTLWAASLQNSLAHLRHQTAALSAVVEADAKRLDRLGNATVGVQQANTLGIQLETAANNEEALIGLQNDPNTILAPFVPTAASHGTTGEYRWSDATGAGTVNVHSLPALPLGGAYRVWLEDNLSRLLVAASLSPDANGNAEAVLQVKGRIQPVRIYVVAASRADDPTSTGPVVLLATIPR